MPAPEARERLRATAAAGIDWDRLWALGHLHEVIPLLARSLPSAADASIPETWRAAAVKRRHVTLRSNATLADALMPILEGMDRAGIPAMPVKGLVIADRLYGDLAARPCADLDVLVRPADYAAAGTVLHDLGFRQRGRAPLQGPRPQVPRPRLGSRIGIGPRPPRTPLGPVGRQRANGWAPTGCGTGQSRTTLLGHPIRTLSTEDTLLHLADPPNEVRSPAALGRRRRRTGPPGWRHARLGRVPGAGPDRPWPDGELGRPRPRSRPP